MQIQISSLRVSESENFYLNKIQKIKNVSQTDGLFKKEKDEKARTSFLLAMNNYNSTHYNVFINR